MNFLQSWGPECALCVPSGCEFMPVCCHRRKTTEVCICITVRGMLPRYPDQRYHTATQQAWHHSVLHVPVPTAHQSPDLTSPFIYPDLAFGFQSEIHYFYFQVTVVAYYLWFMLLTLLQTAFLIALPHGTSMEQIADLYALEHITKTSASTTCQNGTRNSNSSILA